MSMAFTPGFGGGNRPTIVNPNPTLPLVIFTAFDVHAAEELKRRLQTTVRPAQYQTSPQKPKADDRPAPTHKQGAKSAAKSAGKKRQRQRESEPSPSDLPQDIEEDAEVTLPDLEKAWSSADPYLHMGAADLSYYMSAQEDQLVRGVAISLKHEKFILHYLDNPTEYLKRFATYTWDEESDEAAEEFIQWYVERFRPELERQRDIDWAGGAESDLEYWIRDVANDERESVIVYDLESGETLFVRYGDKNSVALQDWQQKLAQGRNIVLIHNHPNNTGASLADLSAAAWLDAELMIVVNPDGTLHRYALEGDEMVALEPVHNPDYVAPADPVETLAADVAYWAQTLRELGNPPEMVMRQGEEQVVIDAGGDTRITLPPLEGPTLEVSQKLAEHLWNNLVADFESWAYESYGYVPQAGTPEYFDLIVDLTQKWWTFSEKETSRQRDAAYKLRYEMVERAVGIQSGIKFFHAAQTVNHIMSLGEYAGNIIYAGLSDTIDNVTDNFNQVGKKLIDHNDPILAAVLENDGKLPSPYHNSLEDFDASTAIYVDTAIDWDIHMVWREQGKVGEYIDDLEIKENHLEEITDLFGLKDRLEGGDFAIGESAAAIDWAARAVGSFLDFDQLEDRITLGVAMIFQKQGYDEDEFKIYYDEMMKWVNRQAGQDKFRLPKVEEVLPQYD